MLAIIAVSLTAIFISIRYRVRSSVAAVPGIPAEGDGGASQSSQRGPSVAGAASVMVQRFRRDCDPGHRRHRNPPFCDDPHKRAGVVLTKSRRCNCSVTFCSAARISACASRRRKSTFSAARSPSRSPRPEFHQIRFLQQNLRSAVFATCPS